MSSGIKIRKRSGHLATLDISNIRKHTKPACDGLNVSYEELELDAAIQFTDGMKSTDIQQTLINTAKSKVDLDAPNWTYVAARLKLYDMYHVVKRNYGLHKEKGEVYSVITLSKYLEKCKDYLDIDTSLFDVDDLQLCIKPERDLLYKSLGVKTLRDRYLLKDKGDLVELPQHLYLAISMWLSQKELNPQYWAKEFYEALSSLEVVLATPTLANGRLKNKSHASCFFGTTPDDLDGIFDTYKTQANISKNGGGIGWDWTRIRALGGKIQNTRGVAGGVVPWLKIENDVAIAVDQLGVRQGAIAVYLETWHLDIFDFLDLKKSSGEERRRAEDLFIAVTVSDLFMERCEADAKWTLFDPYDTPDLPNMFGPDFAEAYIAYETKAKTSPEQFTNPPKQIDAKELMRKIVSYYFETGQPFIYFKDTANEANKHKELGVIRSSNLCMEQIQPTSDDEIAVCNLAAINFGKVTNLETLRKVTPVAVRMLDNVVSLSNYPHESARKTQMDRRAVGLGVMGEAQLVANKRIMYGSEEHLAFIKTWYSVMQEEAWKASEQLATEKGAWRPGYQYRNAYLMNLQPTASVSLIAGTTASHEAVFKKIWSEGSKLDKTIITAPDITLDNYPYYVDAYSVDQFDAINATAERQKHIDMGISHNIYVRPDVATGKLIYDLIVHAWKKRLKTLYYFRSDSQKVDTSLSDSITCSGCQ